MDIGIYELSQDVVNPVKDGRSKQWSNLPLLPKGTLFRLIVEKEDKILESIELPGFDIRESNENKKPLFDLILSSLIVAKPTFETIVHCIGYTDRSFKKFVEWLISSGKMSLEEFQQFVNEKGSSF